MHVGCLGHPLRPPRWPSRRTKWRNLIRASELSAVLIAVLIAGKLRVEQLRRSATDAGHGMGAVVGSPAPDGTSPEGTSHRSMEVDDHPRPTDIATSAVVHRNAEPNRSACSPTYGRLGHTHRPLRQRALWFAQSCARLWMPPGGRSPAAVLTTAPVLPSGPVAASPGSQIA
jgi:hypothetical protein